MTDINLTLSKLDALQASRHIMSIDDDLVNDIREALAIAMAPKAETEGLRGLSPAKRGAKQSPKVSQ